jgi:serine/threonine-protein kinase PRP4
MASSASSDEGEIRDNAGGIEKATTSLLDFDGTSVDRQDRNRSRSSTSKSPSFENGAAPRDRRDNEKTRSSYADHNSRGSKRSRDEDHYDRRHADPRRFKVHYEDRPTDRRRARVSYEDLDNGSASSPDLRYDDHDQYSEKRARTRSRSPYRAPRADEKRDRDSFNQRQKGRDGNSKKESGRYPSYAEAEKSVSSGHGSQRNRTFTDQSVSKRENGPVPADVSQHEAKFTQGSSYQHNDTASDAADTQM